MKTIYKSASFLRNKLKRHNKEELRKMSFIKVFHHVQGLYFAYKVLRTDYLALVLERAYLLRRVNQLSKRVCLLNKDKNYRNFRDIDKLLKNKRKKQGVIN